MQSTDGSVSGFVDGEKMFVFVSVSVLMSVRV